MFYSSLFFSKFPIFSAYAYLNAPSMFAKSYETFSRLNAYYDTSTNTNKDQ